MNSRTRHPRFTKDLDIWVWVDEQNANRLVAALDEFGLGSLGLTADDFLEESMVVQLGYRVCSAKDPEGHFSSFMRPLTDTSVEVLAVGKRRPPSGG
ncbi:MAG TPA: hypothetical protein VH561_01610 [Micromonosporaceae bacterium]